MTRKLVSIICGVGLWIIRPRKDEENKKKLVNQITISSDWLILENMDGDHITVYMKDIDRVEINIPTESKGLKGSIIVGGENLSDTEVISLKLSYENRLKKDLNVLADFILEKLD